MSNKIAAQFMCPKCGAVQLVHIEKKALEEGQKIIPWGVRCDCLYYGIAFFNRDDLRSIRR